MTTRLHVCQTCVRDGAREADGRTRGQHLTEALLGAVGESPDLAELVIRKVPCLSGCLSPCNVSLRAPGKASLRFSRLTTADAAAVLDAVRAHARSASGELTPGSLPETLRERLSARTPAPPGARQP